jgi:hypothetical protein
MKSGFSNNGFRAMMIAVALIIFSGATALAQVISGEVRTIKIKETEADKPKTPAIILECNVVFNDNNHNGVLEAGENATLDVEIVNNGIKTAFDVRVTCVESEKSTKGFFFSSSIIAGDILARDSKKVSLALSADNQIGNNEVRLVISTKDREGNEAMPLAKVIPTRPKMIPFTAEWLSPAVNDTTVYAQSVNVKIRIHSSSDLKDIVLRNNHIDQIIDYNLTRDEMFYNLTYKQQLDQGDNYVEIKVGNQDNQLITDSRNIYFINEKRLALVIGNADYLFGTLANPVNDVRSMDDILRKVGFEVLKYENLNQKDLKKAIDVFGSRLSGYDVGLFYYAGHGIQANGFNYLIPVDAQLTSYEDIDYDCVRADRILGKMEFAATKVNIIILDACRNNPFERQWSRAASGKGLAFMDAPSGSLIAYATSPGRTAADGAGKNGLYTSVLLKFMQQKGLQIEEIFKNVRREVEEQSGGSQIPWESTSLKGQFFFKR